jgi:hypothetical protein
VADVARDRNGWRFFTPEDVGRIKAYADRQVPPAPPPADRSEVAV